MAAGVRSSGESDFGLRGHVRAFKSGDMSPHSKEPRNETETHARLKRLAFIWAQAQGFSACAMEVTLPNCRYRADVAGHRWQRKQTGSTAIFECKQALCDLRRDNCHSKAALERLDLICQRRQILEARICKTSPRSVIAVTRIFCVTCVRCKIGCTTAPSSTN